ncbi:MAG: stage III sporulation protein AD [Lawsonibacter sp.]|nr:stage III sporulation protein AD [Lawsonibacter sp.]
MEAMVKAAALALTAALCAGVVRRGAPELALLLALAAGGGILMLGMGALAQTAAALERMADAAQLGDELVRPVVKTVALSLISRVTAELCRSAGEGGAAAFVELAGTVLALGAALPLAEGVLELMAQLLT